METTIYYWDDMSLSEITGYNHLEKHPYINTLKIVKKIFAMGLNVMINHIQNGVILYVSQGRFTQK